jgi:hypothetical protein
VIVVDTSAWVEFLRGTGSATDRTLTKAIRQDQPLGGPGRRAVGAARLDLPVLAGDRDYATLAAVSPLQLV